MTHTRFITSLVLIGQVIYIHTYMVFLPYNYITRRLDMVVTIY